MFGTASRHTTRKVSAAFCACACCAIPSNDSAATMAPRTVRLNIVTSDQSLTLAHEMALDHALVGKCSGLRRLIAAALDRDAAARMKPAARGNIGGIGHDVAEPDVGDAEAGLRRQHALEQGLRV